MDMSNSADEPELLETSSKFDASQETAESTDSPSILDRSDNLQELQSRHSVHQELNRPDIVS